MTRTRRSVLIVTGIVPGHRSAGDVRLVHVAALLARTAHVELVAVHRGVDGPDGQQVDHLASIGVGVAHGSGLSALEVALRTRAFDLVVIEFWHVAEWCLPVIRRRQPWAFIAVDTVDLHFVREERGAALGVLTDDPGGERRRRELAVYRSADARIFCTDAEGERYRALTAAPEPTVVVPIAVDAVERPPRSRDRMVVFVGNFWHPPNVDAVVWLGDEIWPRVRARCPQATLVIAGPHVTPDVQCLDGRNGIEVRGFVDDLDHLYQAAAVAVAPLRYGAGMKGKVCEALGAGVPVVSTPVGIEGINVESEIDLLVADDADRFAASIRRLLADPELAEKVGAQGRRSILSQCGPGPVQDGLRQLAAAEGSAAEGSAAEGSAAAAPRWWLARAAITRGWHRVRPRLAGVRRSARRLVRIGNGPRG